MIWYKINYDSTIKKVEVVKETEKFVFVKPYKDRETIIRYAKSNDYFKSFEEAKQYLIDFRVKRIEKLKLDIQRFEYELQKISLMKNNNE